MFYTMPGGGGGSADPRHDGGSYSEQILAQLQLKQTESVSYPWIRKPTTHKKGCEKTYLQGKPN